MKPLKTGNKRGRASRARVVSIIRKKYGMTMRECGAWYDQYKSVERGNPPTPKELDWFMGTEASLIKSAWGKYYDLFEGDIFGKTLHFTSVFKGAHAAHYPYIPCSSVFGKNPQQNPYWSDFVAARRVADGHGAIYEDWVAAIFDKYAHSPVSTYRKTLPPSFFKSTKAAEAYIDWAEMAYYGRIRGVIHPVTFKRDSLISRLHYERILGEARIKARVDRAPLARVIRSLTGVVPDHVIDGWLGQ